MTSIKFLERELSIKTNKKSIKNAYERGDLTIIVSSGVFWFEHIPDRIYTTVKQEIKKYYPDLVYLYDLKKPAGMIDYSAK